MAAAVQHRQIEETTKRQALFCRPVFPVKRGCLQPRGLHYLPDRPLPAPPDTLNSPYAA
jgi:hypothetical protein